METGDKLKHFMDVSMDSAMQKKLSLVNEYKLGLDIQFKNHKQDEQKRIQLQENTLMEQIKRDNSIEYSKQQQHIKRKLTHKKDDLKEQLFDEVKQLLNDYYDTDEYKNLLITEIKEAICISPSDPITIYIDPADKDKKDYLETQTGVEIHISEYSFGRGMRAIIEAKNILVDNSFNTKINDIKDDYTINL